MSVVTRLVPHPNEPSAPLIRSQLDAILASDLFARSERLSQFLRFIVERTLAGEGDALKEQVIAVELYGRGADFNTAADPIVRVDARRLRDKLREYYASAPHDPVRIYYASTASGRSEIWKMQADGTSPVPLTTEGGFDPRESPDGASVYFLDHARWNGPGPPTTLKRVPARGGRASVVRPDVVPGVWDLTDAGVVSVDASVGPITASQPADRLSLSPFAGGPPQLVRELAFPVARWGSRPPGAAPGWYTAARGDAGCSLPIGTVRLLIPRPN